MPEPLRDLFLDHTVRTVALGAATLGIVAGALGTFAVLRRQSLLGDALSHAALPGIALAFLLTGSKAPLALLLGAARGRRVDHCLPVRLLVRLGAHGHQSKGHRAPSCLVALPLRSTLGAYPGGIGLPSPEPAIRHIGVHTKTGCGVAPGDGENSVDGGSWFGGYRAAVVRRPWRRA